KWGLDEGDLSVNCTVTGAFKERQDDETARDIGECITDAYKDEHGNQVQEFGGATVYLNPTTNVAYAQWGATGKKYEEMGGPESWLGYPTFEEKKLSKGDYARYEGGRIHYISEYGAVAVKSDVLSAWAGRDYERGMGYPTADEADVLGADGDVIGQSQTFEQGTFYRNADGGEVYSLKGDINEKYVELGGPAGPLGFPDRNDRELGDEALGNDGSYSRFKKGYIYSSSRSGTHVIYNGPVFDAWKKEGYEHPQGIGYPTSDDDPDSSRQRVVTFERGSVHVDENGEATVTRYSDQEADQDPDTLDEPVSEEPVPAPVE
ncbi:MAG: trehalose corynomycolyl transferase, partial [Corynebacterium variabile]